MAELPANITDGIETLAKWAAHQPEPSKVGGEIAYLLAKAAEIRRDGTPEQIALVHEAIDEFRAQVGKFNPAWLNRRLDEIMIQKSNLLS